MKIVAINTVCNGSTGKIMGSVLRGAKDDGDEVLAIYGRRKGYKDINQKKIGGFFSFWYHVGITTLFDLHGHGSFFKTKKMVREIRKFNPDIIHLHNIHGYYINYKVLFNYLKKEYKGRIFWTLHDCWPFTGHCPHFELANCYKWKVKCYKCPNKKFYPTSLIFDRSRKNYEEKKKLFNGVKDLTIITPSIWLKELVSKSFLKSYKTVAINNGINLDLFKSRVDESLYSKYNIPKDRKVLLGIASVWTKRKGFDDFLLLSEQISSDYVIMLIGLNDRQMKIVKKYNNIIGIKRTENQIELASLYSMSYCFVNPTYEDNYPTVNIEALACHLRVIAYDTGGCVEQSKNPNMYIVKKTTKENNVKNIINLLEKIDEYQDFDISIYSDKLFTKRVLEEYRK